MMRFSIEILLLCLFLAGGCWGFVSISHQSAGAGASASLDYRQGLVAQYRAESSADTLEDSGGSFPANGEAIADWRDESASSNDAVAITDVSYSSGEDSASFDGTASLTAEVESPLSSESTLSVFIVMKKAAAEDKFVAVSDGSTTQRFAGVVEDGSSSGTESADAGTPSYRVNDTEVGTATRNALHDAMPNDAYFILDITGIDASAWTNIEIGYSAPSFSIDAYVKEIRFYNASLSSENRTKVHDYLAAEYGL